MIVALMMTMENSHPEISRLVNVEDDVRLNELAPLIDAAFGFSGTATHLFMGKFDGESALFSAAPSKGERDESEVMVGDLETMTYVYDPSANWNIALEVLGTTDIDAPSPMLVDAQGPDVIEACGGPEMMTTFHKEARRLAAGLEPDMKVSPLLLSFMPVMGPERLIQRLAYADHPSVSERISFTAENLFLGSEEFDEFMDAPETPALSEEFEAFMDARPELQQILSLDPNPERNPAIIAAISEFFADHAPHETEERFYPFTRVINNIRSFVYHCSEPVKLTSRGRMRAADVRTLAESIGLPVAPGNHREESLAPIGALRVLLQFMDLLRVEFGYIEATEGAFDLVDDPEVLITMFRHEAGRFYANQHGEDIEHIFAWAFYASGGAGPQAVSPPPADPEFTVNLLIALGILDPGSTVDHPLMTVPGRDVLATLIDYQD